MINKFPFSYCILQYKHNTWSEERINVGILIFSHSENLMKFKYVERSKVLYNIYSKSMRKNFSEDIHRLSILLDNFYKKNIFCRDLFQKIDFNVKNINLAHEIAQSAAPDFDSSYVWTPGGTGICSSLEARLEYLFSSYISVSDDTPSQKLRDDEAVWSSLKEIISERDLLKSLEPEPRVDTELGSVKFHSGYQNGAYHVLQPLSFDLSNDDYIMAKAGKWGGFSQALQDRSGKRKVCAHYLIGRPSREDLLPSYHSAYKFLRNIVGQEGVVEEQDSVVIANKIERDLTTHNAG